MPRPLTHQHAAPRPALPWPGADPAVEEWRGGAATLEEWGRKEAARCDAGDPDIELCELPEIIDAMPPAERSAADEAWTRGRCGGG